MRHFFELCHRQQRGLLALFAALALLGTALGVRLPAAILPEIAFPRITVIADSGERPADDMVRAVTRPLEEELRRVPEVREIRSKTSRGSTEILLDCAWRVPMAPVLQQVQAQVEAARGRLPAGTEIQARLMSPAIMPVLGMSLTSKTRSPAELRDLALVRLQPELARLPGVAEVNVQGGERLEARVALDPYALEARGLDATRVADAIRNSAALASVGLVETNGQLYLGLADARALDVPALSALPVPLEGGGVATLGQLGKVTLEPAPEFTRYRAHGQDAVLVNFMRKPTGSTVELSRAAHGWFDTHKEALPADIHLETWYDQADLVTASIGGVRDALLIGAFFAIVIVLLFLRSIRLGLSAALVLPGAIALTLGGLVATGQTLNLMTLGGIAAAVGLVLDDAIVVIEHLAHRASEGIAARPAMIEIAPTLIGSSLCTLAIFIPFMALGGLTGAFFRVLALAIAFMLAASLAICLVYVPWIPLPKKTHEEKPGRFHRLHERMLGVARNRRWLAFVVPLLLVAVLWPLSSTLGSGFLPEMDEGSLILDYVAPPGASASETDRMLRLIEQDISAVPEIVAWSRRTGNQLGFFITEPNNGDYVLRLAKKRSRSAEEVADGLREQIAAKQPALEVEFGQLIEDVVGDLTSNPQPIEIRVLGEDRVLDQQRAEQIAHLIEAIKGVVDVKSGVVVSGPQFAIAPGAGAHRAGLGADALSEFVTPYVRGLDAGIIPRGARAWPVRVTMSAPAGSPGVAALAEARVPVAPGHWARLGDLATLVVTPGETEIARDDQRTMVSATARLSGRDLGSAMGEIQRRVGKEVALAPGMAVRYAGQWAEQQQSFKELAIVLLGAIVAILLVLLFAFRSWRLAGSVLAIALASLAGVFVALHLWGATFNIASFVGAIMVVGIVAENAYFLVAAYLEALAKGETPADAAEAAAHRRARPVLMTTLAGVAALAPLAIGQGSGAELLRPLAIAVIGGFAGSAPLLLLVLPHWLAASGRPARLDGAKVMESQV